MQPLFSFFRLIPVTVVIIYEQGGTRKSRGEVGDLKMRRLLATVSPHEPYTTPRKRYSSSHNAV
jgi:hypothetical protein